MYSQNQVNNQRPQCTIWAKACAKSEEVPNVLMHNITEVVEHSLHMVVQEFKKIHVPNISKLEGGYSANTAFIFNSWLKEIDMCVQDDNFTKHEAVQLVKDYKTEHAHRAIEFYLKTNDQWSYSKLIKHLRMSLESGETFSSLLTDLLCEVPETKRN